MSASLFYNPLQLSSQVTLWLMIPLWLAVAVVYKTVRSRNLRRLPMEIVGAMLYLLAGTLALAVALWLIHEFCA